MLHGSIAPLNLASVRGHQNLVRTWNSWFLVDQLNGLLAPALNEPTPHRREEDKKEERSDYKVASEHPVRAGTDRFGRHQGRVRSPGASVSAPE